MNASNSALSATMSQLTLQQTIDLGLEHHRAGRLHQAEQLYRQVLSAQPNHPWALQLLGMLAYQAGNAKLAIELIRRAIAIDPSAADFHGNLGEILRSVGALDQAEASLLRCLQLQPHFAPAYSNLGEIYREQGQLDRACQLYRKAIELDPTAPASYNNLGIATHDLGDPQAAIDFYQRAIELGGEYAEAINNLATSYLDLRRVDEAVAGFRHTIALDPNNADAHNNLAFALLLRGEFEKGWEEYEWRWKSTKFPSPWRGFTQPLWNGENISGQHILVYAEQGLGDTIQFARYLPMLIERGARVIVECNRSLLPVLAQIRGVKQFIAYGDPLPDFAWQVPMLSLPRAFGTTVETIPSSIPYLHADAEWIVSWRGKLAAPDRKKKVGLVWAGSPTHSNDRNRTITLSKLSALAGVADVRWYSSQFGPAAEQIAKSGFDLINLTPDVRDFADTAAILQDLDLLITVDTSVAHLAGAMGRPVWVLIPFNADWRWMLAGESSPWYPTMRLFRQDRYGSWDAAIARLVDELARFAASTIPAEKI